LFSDRQIAFERSGIVFSGNAISPSADVITQTNGTSRAASAHTEAHILILNFVKEDSMKNTISTLLEAYEKGKMSRRALIQGLAVLAASSGTAEAAGFQGNSINHISLQVSNLQRSTDFYQRVLGCTVNKREGNNQLVFGKNFLVLRPGTPAAKVDHFAIGVDNFKQDSVTADLKARGATPINQQGGGFGFHVLDPDGFPIQISANNP
jgi:catechol 2,3-dioxygenase-like lactoylglutathione lyase family enzyme